MEDIIIWIVIIAIGAFFEWLKKRGASDKGESKEPYVRTRPEPCNDPWASIPDSVASSSTYQATTSIQPSQAAPAQPRNIQYQPISHTDDCPMAVESLDQQPSAQSSLSDDDTKERMAHYARWRQAILDTQVLERKF